MSKYSKERIEQLIKSQVRYWRYDAREDVYVNCWTVSNHGDFGFFPNGAYKPEFKTKEEAEKAFRSHLESL